MRFNFLYIAIWIVMITIISGCGSSSKSADDSVSNIAPIVNASDNKTIEVNKVIKLTGTATDSDGTIIKYEWKKGTTVLATTASFDYIPTKVGTDTLTFSATDNDGESASDSVDIIVTATHIVNKEPTVTASPVVNKEPTVTATPVLNNNLKPQDEPYYKYAWYINSKNSVLNSKGYTIDKNADIGIEEAWRTTMGEGVIVAVIDDGADLEHEDLKENILKSYNSVSKNSTAQYVGTEKEPSSHGNTCSGFIVAPVNGKGIVGIAPKSKVIIIQNPEDSTDAELIDAFEYAKNQGAKVISCSWGTDDVSEAIVSELKSLYNANITVLFASGNDGKTLDEDGINDESEVEWVIGVGASGENNDVTSYSNYGENIDVIAPGGDTEDSIGVLGLDDMGDKGNTKDRYLVNTNYQFTDGSSYSTPITAGVVALMYATNPNITPAQVKNILITTADKIGVGTGASYEGSNKFDIKRAYGKVRDFASAIALLAFTFP